MNYEALDEALDFIEYIEESKVDKIANKVSARALSQPSALAITAAQTSKDIKEMKDKLSELKSKEEKVKYLKSKRVQFKKAVTWRKNSRLSKSMKSLVDKAYAKRFKFIDSELAKLEK